MMLKIVLKYKLILKTSLIKAKEIIDYNSKTIKIINTFINKKTCINIYGNDIYGSKECPSNKEELLLDSRKILFEK